ncbi:tail fiber domain-containing protein, partial [uncultured Planktosalinus sp.]|uniref:tail fiber domain-containing protein n=1 Tax=uncultured Planktosalinus sp. TaxID=1810935 RepID=UPI0030D8FF69
QIFATENYTEIERFNFTNNGRLRAYGNGSEGQPTFSWNGDTNTGMWRPNADNLAFSTNGAERMRISTNGNVGVNTSNPIYKLHLSNNAENIGATTLIGSINEGNDGVSFLGNNTNVLNNYNGIEGGTSYSLNTSMTAAIFGLAITNSGNGIGVRGHSNSFQGIGVRGSRTNSGGPDTGWGGLFLNDLGYTGGLYNASDSRLKKNIQPINNATSILKQLNPVTYFYDVEKYNSLGFNEDLEYGLIAQEVKEILPTLVKEKSLFIKSKSGVSQLNTTEEGTSQNFLMIDYSRLTPILIQAVKEQQEIIESQENRIAKLEALVNQLINKK